VFGRRKREEQAAAEAVREEERRALFARLAERPENVCPFLGLEGERAGYVDGVSDEHRCFAFGDPVPLSAEQQTRVCQERGYGNCPRYLRGVLVIPTSELEALRHRRAPAAASAEPAAPAGPLTNLTSPKTAEPPKLAAAPPDSLIRQEQIEPDGTKTEWDKLREEQEQEGPRFSAFLWVGLLLLIVAAAGLGAYMFRDQLGLIPPDPTPTPRATATATPDASAPGSAEPSAEGTPLPTPPPLAWQWVSCEPELPCADEVVIRDQMASFLSAAFELEPITEGQDAFDDIAGNEYRGQINAVAAEGLTVGCTSTAYCPAGQVTREQMATFIQRAFDIPATNLDFFDDDESSPHEAAINAVTAAGVAQGCGRDTFCPSQTVTRGEIAGVIHRALNR
jgi:hypothetical protein